MGWTKLDSAWPRNPKVQAMSDRAKVVDLTAMCFCSEQLTDGLLPQWFLAQWPKRIVQECIAAGRWDVREDGVWVHDYLEFNPSKEEVLATRNARSIAARSRWSKAKSTPNALGDGTGREAKQGDALFEAVAEACGIDWKHLTPSARGSLNRACADLRAADANPAEVPARSEAYRRKFPDAALTPSALAKHWPALRPIRAVGDTEAEVARIAARLKEGNAL